MASSAKEQKVQDTQKMSFLGINKIWKTPTGLDSHSVSSEEFVAIDDDNGRTAPMREDKDILEFVER
ncbi:hypothetical protein TNCV_3951211 [Trichonephila clavipes]|nr:hypothetical protein TNCV_3951211 [Trichonephila clavipes]